MLVEALFLIVLRVILFFSCRTYLLQSLYSDLQDLSAISADGASIPLEPLPTPSTHNSRSSKKALHSSVSRTVFSACFSECCVMFLLLMFQGFGMLDPIALLQNWKASLILLLVIILILAPSGIILLLSIGVAETRFLPRLAFGAILVGLWLFAFSCIPLPAALSSSDLSTSTISRVIVLGTIILGLLSGFGSISSIWTFLPPIKRSRPQATNADIVAAESSLAQVRDDLQRRRMEVQRRKISPVEVNWLSRLMPTFRTDESAQEMQGLEALEYQMSANIADLRQQRENARFAGTFKGRVYHASGCVFALYCYFRVVSSLIGALLPSVFSPTTSSSTNYPDLVTQAVGYLISRISPDVDLDRIAIVGRQVSLVLVGAIILASIRLVLTGVTRALRVTSRNLGASLMLLVLAQLMGIYLLSTVVQLRNTFPPPPESSNLFSTIPQFEVFGLLFNWSFLAAAGPAAAVRWVAERVSNVD